MTETDFGQRLATRVAARTGARRHLGRSRSIGIVSRSSVGFGQAIGRSTQTRPSVTSDSLTSLRLRPPAGWWHTLGTETDEPQQSWTDDLVPRTRHTARRTPAPSATPRRNVPTGAAAPAAPSPATAPAPAPTLVAPTGLGRLDALRNLLASGTAPDGSRVDPDVLKQQQPDAALPVDRAESKRPRRIVTPPVADVPGQLGEQPIERVRHTDAGPATGPGALSRRMVAEPVAPGTTATRPTGGLPGAPARATEPRAQQSDGRVPRIAETPIRRAWSTPDTDAPSARWRPAAEAGPSPFAPTPGTHRSRPATQPSPQPAMPSTDARPLPGGATTAPASSPNAGTPHASAPGSADARGTGSVALPDAVVRPDQPGGSGPGVTEPRVSPPGPQATVAQILRSHVDAPADATSEPLQLRSDDLRAQRLIGTDPARNAAKAEARRHRPAPVGPGSQPAPLERQLVGAGVGRTSAPVDPAVLLAPLPALPGSDSDRPIRRVTLPRAMSRVHRPAPLLLADPSLVDLRPDNSDLAPAPPALRSTPIETLQRTLADAPTMPATAPGTVTSPRPAVTPAATPTASARPTPDTPATAGPATSPATAASPAARDTPTVTGTSPAPSLDDRHPTPSTPARLERTDSLAGTPADTVRRDGRTAPATRELDTDRTAAAPLTSVDPAVRASRAAAEPTAHTTPLFPGALHPGLPTALSSDRSELAEPAERADIASVAPPASARPPVDGGFAAVQPVARLADAGLTPGLTTGLTPGLTTGPSPATPPGAAAAPPTGPSRSTPLGADAVRPAASTPPRRSPIRRRRLDRRPPQSAGLRSAPACAAPRRPTSARPHPTRACPRRQVRRRERRFSGGRSRNARGSNAPPRSANSRSLLRWSVEAKQRPGTQPSTTSHAQPGRSRVAAPHRPQRAPPMSAR